jgi:hypothetical protein
MPVGVDAQFEQSHDGTVTWKITRRRNNWISFSETSSTIQLMAPDNDTLRQVTAIVSQIPDIVPVSATRVPAPSLAPPAATQKERIFRLKKAFRAEEESELSCDMDQLVVLITDDDGWAGVRKVNGGQQGFVPKVYLEELI